MTAVQTARDTLPGKIGSNFLTVSPQSGTMKVLSDEACFVINSMVPGALRRVTEGFWQ